MIRSFQYLLTVGIIGLLFSAHANAESHSLVISHVQAGALSGQVAASTQEFVVVYNNSDSEVDVTDWCIANKDKTIACMAPTSNRQLFYLPARASMVFISESFSVQHPGYVADMVYEPTNLSSGSIVSGADTITLRDAHGTSVDVVSWASSLQGGTSMQRRIDPDLGVMIDTDQPTDFLKSQIIDLPASGVYEVVAVVDECSNIADVQNEIPIGFIQDEQGDCVFDECSNLDGLQAIIPEEYLRVGSNDCKFDYVSLQITELLPNAAGNDMGREYIELHNPTGREAHLVNYNLMIGSRTYSFPDGAQIRPGEYTAFYNSEIAFTLLNTSGAAILLGDDGSIIDQSDTYDSPDDNMSWSMIDGTWGYSNQMTFASANVASVLEPADIEIASGMTPCAANQYRHPETRRCRMLVTVASAAAPCRDGQYRSEETNRCRSIALAGGTLTPCKENQYRSEETNRCRNLTSLASTLTPCRDDQYRSEETNRCRTITAVSAPAAFAVEPIADTDMVFAGWWALGGITALTLSYAAWEWRIEALTGLRKLLSFFTQR